MMTEKTLQASQPSSVAQPITPNTMLAMAIEQGADLDKLEKLMALQERWEANEAKKAYVLAMANFRAECPSINKTKRVDYETQKGRTQYSHAGLSESIEQIKGLLTAHGLSHSWRTGQESGAISVTCCITHVMGHSECTTLTAGADNSGGKNSIQAVASTVTYLERYTLFAILGLASKEQDDDGKKADLVFISTDQATAINDLLNETGSDKQAFLKWLKADNVESIQASAYDMVIKALEKKRSK